MFRDELRQAKEVVQEPPQPKIKIKSAAAVATPSSSKKITIHVANTRGSSAESPVGKTAGSVSSDAPATAGRAAATPLAVEKTRGLSKASPSPSAAVLAVNGAKRESSSRASPALSSQRQNGTGIVANGSPALANGTPAAAAAGSPATNGDASAATETPITAPKPPVAPPRPAYENKFREASREPLLTNLTVRTHAAILNNEHRRFEIQLPPHPKLTQRYVTLNIPPGQWRQQLFVSLNPGIQKRQRPFKMFVISNGATLGPSPSPPTPQSTPAPASGHDDNAKLYDVNLHPGVNVIQVQIIAGLAKDQKLPNGADAELEKVTIFANLMKF